MSIESKLALLIMGLPLFILLSLGFGAYFVYGIDPEFISALISTVLVILLVWERLRGSLDRDLEYLHKTVLFRLYSSEFRSDTHIYEMMWRKEELIKARADLERHGKFMSVIRLYPRNLLERLDEFLSLHDSFERNIQEILDFAKMKKEITPMMKLCDQLGFKTGFPDNLNEFLSEAKKLQEEQPELVDNTRGLSEALKEIRKQIHGELEDFFRSYNLRLESGYPSVPVMQ